ncbi:PspC domain-containing protein [Nocardioides donggukensis]|uniref:PspC domain-containing protein n=1 Tax=Nocardioides donggukensis TaxID=2774019 RepID=A0A927K2H3_9ACTN|nr:PspC domain-containing protein [Nocardioides donggukensis]MBD8868597.1 PspC domain-containing protein [Nocardioides donggukensis]
MRDLTLLRRSRTDRRVAGVAGGLGRHLDIDPIILRVGFVVLAFFGGAGLLLYAAGWLLLPEDGDEHGRLDLDPRTRSVALVGVGVLGGLLVIGDAWAGPGWFPWPLLLIGLIAWLVLSNRDRRRERRAAAYPGTPGATASDPVASGPAASDPVGNAAAGGSAAAGGPPSGYLPPPAPPRWTRDPRKRGPKLFWFTMALAALAVGTLGIVDTAGASVADSAYPALVLAVVAVMLVVGAFYGRAGGLILVGLIALLVTVIATLDRYDGREVDERPTSAAEVEAEYWNSAGEMRIDLRSVADLDALDGRTIDVGGTIGKVEVIVPDGLDVEVSAEVGGPGSIRLFGDEREGIDVRDSARIDGGVGVPEVTIEAHISVGEIEVTQR